MYLDLKISTMYLCSCCIVKHFLLLLRCDLGKVRDRCGDMGRFKGRLKCKGWVSHVITDVITCWYFKKYNMYVHNKSIVSNYLFQ